MSGQATAEATEEPRELPGHLRLDPARVADASFSFLVKQVTVPHGTPGEHVWRPEFWSKCIALFTSATHDQARHLIVVDWPEHPEWFVLLRVIAVGTTGIRVQKLIALFPEHDEMLEFARPGPPGTNMSDFEVRPLGPAQGYAVIQIRDGKEMYRSMTKAACLRWIGDRPRQARS